MKSHIKKSLFSLFSPGGASGRLSILLFHRVPTVVDPLIPAEIDLNRFERILDLVATTTNVMPLTEATAALKRGKLPPRATALTFDDGYAEWIGNVSPALRRRNLPATFFVTTGQLSGSALWHERIAAAVRALPDMGAALPYGFGNYADLSAQERRISLINDLLARLKYASVETRNGAIELLEVQAVSPLILPQRFDASAVRTLHGQGFEIGAHTVHHPILNECTRAQAREEIGNSKEQLEAIIGARVTAFAYPNGYPNEDYRLDHVDMVKSFGYTAAVTTSDGVADATSDLFQLPRFTPWALDEKRIVFQLLRNMRTKPKVALTHGTIDTANPHEVATAATPVRCLLIASTFAPIHGGSAVVYENLCEQMPHGSIRVLTAKLNYLNNRAVEGWREHDDACEFPIDRISLLRPLMAPPPANILVSIYRLLFQDVPLYINALMAASRIVRAHDINVVCVGELVAGSWLGLALRKIHGCKFIIYVHGEEITTATSGRFYGNQRKSYLQAADKVIAVSSFTCDALTKLMDTPPASIKLIQNGVDTDRFTPGEPAADLIAKHQLAGKQVILTVGRMASRKGVDMAVRAMAKVVKLRPAVHYLIVGDGEIRAEIEKLIISEGMSDYVTLVGMVSDCDLVRYLRLCDVFLMPNRTMPDGDTEGFGLVFREANACRKPVIGGRAGGVVEAVVDGQTGLLVDGYNVGEIADAVERILSDAALSEQFSKNGLKLALDNNTKSVANQFLKSCERLLVKI